MVKEKRSKELDAICSAINAWVNKNKGNVIFHGGFVVFDKDGNPTENLHIAYGNKCILLTDLEIVDKCLNKEKGEFVNW